MNEAQNNNLLYAIQTLGKVLEDKDYTIQSKQYRIETLEREKQDLRDRYNIEMVETYKNEINTQAEYIKHLEAKIYDLEERVAIMTESEAPLQPEWEITDPKKDITEVTNITEVIKGE